MHLMGPPLLAYCGQYAMLVTLAQLLTDSVLRRKAGAQSYQRGTDYYRHGHVESVDNCKNSIRAGVRGQFDYEVKLSVVNGELDYECDCPVGKQGDFCKHCVAAGLAWIHSGAAETPGGRITMDDVTKRLKKEPIAKLVKMIVDWAADDELLRQRLLHYGAQRAGPQSAVAAARAAFAKAAKPRRYYEYGDDASYADAVDDAIDTFEKILEDGNALPVIDLCEDGIRALYANMDMVDDDGEIFVLAERLWELHLRACRQAVPDPAALAARLFELQIDDEIDVTDDLVETYAQVLGPAGLASYKTLVYDPSLKQSTWLNEIRESVARAAGDIDGLIEALRLDLTSGHRYAAIFDVCLGAKRFDDALHWAERGFKAYPDDSELREILANEYHRRNEHQKAMRLIWPVFTDGPNIYQYKRLAEHAKKASDWPEWRDNAIGLVRQRIAANGRGDYSLLVEIFLDESNKEEAWREAQNGGCSAHLWFTLAQEREKDHPGDAAPIYLRQAELEVSRITNGDYDNPVALLIRTAAVMKRIGASAEFVRQIDLLRLKYKAKRNFVKLLDQRRAQLTAP